jgi:hypothetical protein
MNQQIISPAGQQRRRLLQTMLFSAGGAMLPPLLTGCGSEASGPTPTGGIVNASNANASALANTPLFANIGPLRDADANGVRTPAGFSTRVVAINNQPPVAGGSYNWHIFNDGGGVLALSDGGWIYCSNSEVPGFTSIGFQEPRLAPVTNNLAFAPGLGGASALRFAKDGTIVDAYRILSNTTFNCAGVITPWGTWLSCEEIPEGLVWECDPLGRTAAVAKPALGKFAHEAVAIDASRRVFYMTEDQPDGRFYRWVPSSSDWPAGAARARMENGTLQVLKVGGAGLTGALTAPQPITWINAQNPTEGQGENRIDGTGVFDGGEGIWYHNDFVFFTTKGDDTVWAVDTVGNTIEVIYRANPLMPARDILTGVDNITITPFGEILVAEDGGDLQVVILNKDGSLKPLLQIVGQDQSEVAGIAFNPDFTRMYFTSDRGGPAPGGGYTNGLGMLYELRLPPR